ncbi:MAG: RRXRR domain-containing protein [Pseudomonadota bacterium]|nr:RRXRR domain-containing protein [Pseudomonadota bacterium]
MCLSLNHFRPGAQAPGQTQHTSSDPRALASRRGLRRRRRTRQTRYRAPRFDNRARSEG